MKKIIFLFSLITLTLFSCEEVTTPDLGVNIQWLQFESQEINGTESGGAITVPVQLAADSNTNGLEVAFTIDASLPDGYTIIPSDYKVTIPAGEFVANIVITPIDNASSNEDLVIKFSFDNPSLPIGLLGQGLINHETTVTILDDDCALVIEDFYGDYAAEEDGYSTIYTITASEGTNPNEIVLTNLWDSGFVATATLDNSDAANPILKWTAGEKVSDAYEGTFIYNWIDYGYDSPISTFRTCDKYMDLNGIFDLTQYGGYDFHIQLTKK